MKIENAMVLAAGLGTRLRPVTNTMPKPLVPIAGKAMIDYGLDALEAAGVTQAVVNVHHFAGQMIDHLSRRNRPEILISDETEALMNSGGGLAKGLRLLGSEPVFVLNADLFWVGERADEKTNLRRLAAFFDPDRMDMAMLCVRLENTTGHNGRNDFSMDADGRLIRFSDGDGEPVVYAGAIAMMPALLDDAPDEAFNLNIYFDRAIAGGRLYGLILEGHWITVGTPEAIAEAEAVIGRLAGAA
ncbi:MurNAc alpha-1-phosphate uridylyltransferase [Rhizobium azooxidifex]|uniref:MurNAc alpha-1-phosphate uridylyltransferase n=1 Tax=Mycoplana azooxidifex TaxID=1636188 RepID=A0A7W6DCB5_9HYPH|nr:nucleotidyltransferase family protein [Mycoplana azooxidifex]MBB3977173.1 MurNAc alpha-1-phosphate uridylyltransferase [Mycoplana azooxidifex]